MEKYGLDYYLMAVRTLKKCHRKHCLNDDSIGWDELTDEINNTLSEIMGNEEYCKYLERMGV